MASQSVVPPPNMGEKPPFNKNLLWVVAAVATGVIAVSAFIGSTAMKTANSALEDDKKEDTTEYTQGTSRSIDGEYAQMQESLKRRSAVPTAPELEIASNSSPLPDEQRQSKGITKNIGSDKPDNLDGYEINAAGAVSSLSIFDEDGENQIFGYQNKPQKTGDEIGHLIKQEPLSEIDAIRKAYTQSAALQGRDLAVTDTSSLSNRSNKFLASLEGKPKKILRPEASPGDWIITAGKIIPAVTTRSQNSDLPCAIQAVVSVDVYDSITSTKVLIPKGSELVGVCSNDIALGQDRILSAFNRLILPDGRNIDLANGVGMDRSGATGAKGDVDNHFMKMFASSFLIAYTADRFEKRNGNSNTGIYSSQSGAQTAAGEVLVDVAEHILRRHREVQPTIFVEQGVRMNIQVAHDMVFD